MGYQQKGFKALLLDSEKDLRSADKLSQQLKGMDFRAGHASGTALPSAPALPSSITVWSVFQIRAPSNT